MRTLVITPCSAKKRGNVPDPARALDLADPRRSQQAKARLAEFACPAADMYTGTHHRLVMDGVRAVWECWGRDVLDLTILSAGYGLLDAQARIIPYDVTFHEFNAAELAQWVAHLQIPERATALVRDSDLVFFLLSGRYLQVLGLPLDVPSSVTQIVLTDQQSLHLVPPAANVHSFIADGAVAARRWHVKAPHVRGFLFGRLCKQIVQHGPVVLDWLHYHPEDTESLFYKRARWRPQWPLWKTA
ncbi:MAG: hypothetical protein PVH17_10730 [Anaerolineae bacterium]|jgi:hypothetical protein